MLLQLGYIHGRREIEMRLTVQRHRTMTKPRQRHQLVLRHLGSYCSIFSHVSNTIGPRERARLNERYDGSLCVAHALPVAGRASVKNWCCRSQASVDDAILVLVSPRLLSHQSVMLTFALRRRQPALRQRWWLLTGRQRSRQQQR
jgi:hypothetical protein